MKTSELTGPALDWAVAFALGAMNNDPSLRTAEGFREHQARYPQHCYVRYWSQGGPIIGRECIALDWVGSEWAAKSWELLEGKILRQRSYAYGPTPLIAAMRCFVASKLGDEVDVPEELL